MWRLDATPCCCRRYCDGCFAAHGTATWLQWWPPFSREPDDRSGSGGRCNPDVAVRPRRFAEVTVRGIGLTLRELLLYGLLVAFSLALFWHRLVWMGHLWWLDGLYS